MSALSLAARRARVLALGDLLAGGRAVFYPLPVAASPDVVASGPALACVDLPALQWDGSAPAALGLGAQAFAPATDSGLIGWVRFVSAAGEAVLDCRAGLPGAGEEVSVSNGAVPPSLQVFTGGEVRLVAFAVSEA